MVIGPDHPDSFADNIASTFNAHGTLAVVVSPFAAFTGSGRWGPYGSAGRNVRRVVTRIPPLEARLMRRPIEKELRRADPRLVISTYGYFPPGLIEGWRAASPRATWVLWYPDHMVNLGNHQTFLAPWDRLFFKEPLLVDRLRSRTSLPAELLPEACNPAYHRSEPWASEEERQRYTCDVVVVGNLYVYRLLILEHLPADVDVRVYGGRRPLPRRFARVAQAHAGHAVVRRSKALAFRGAKVVLNTMHFGEVFGVNARLFEATACGGFVATHPVPDLDQYFAAGSEVITFESGNDLRDLLAHYLRPDAEAERRAIAAAGQRRAHSEHTYWHRLRDLLATAGIADDPVFAGVVE